MKYPKIAFFGTPQLARACLAELVNSFQVKLVVTKRDKARGRGKRIKITPVKDLALKKNIEIYQPQKIEQGLIEALSRNRIDLNVVVAFGKILPVEVLDFPKYGSVNLHASLLPKYRGPSPIQSVILNGERRTGLTLQKMNKEMDTGDILIQREIVIERDYTSQDLMEKIVELSPSFLINGIKEYVSGKIKPEKQNDDEATYCSMIKKEDGLIDWSEKALVILNIIRAHNIWPVAFTYLDGKMLKIYNARMSPMADGIHAHYGEVVEASSINGIVIKTGEGMINILDLQLENRKRMSYQEFVNGFRNLKGKVLGYI